VVGNLFRLQYGEIFGAGPEQIFRIDFQAFFVGLCFWKFQASVFLAILFVGDSALFPDLSGLVLQT
jgi:hypothetical protein